MSTEYTDKVAVITGASSGIGFATAQAFAKQGAKVVIADVQTEKGEQAVAAIKQAGGEASFVKTDVSDPRQVESLVAQTIATYQRLDFAINNAGIDGDRAPTADCTEENWDRVIDINLKGVWLCMKNQIPQMLKQGRGCIVNIASIAGVVGFQNMPAYCASKGGVIQLTKTAALEYAKQGVRINAVCPGVIKTPMVAGLFEKDPKMEEVLNAGTPIGRLGSPEEIASAILWLCSEHAGFMIGQPVIMDGGFTAQ
ncbi:MAG: SDR family oxidoreductase [Thiomicrospira sp.]|uniref:SDR family oxidoreductase n=1 Tax=Thiomicrospira sp. TaxID=935 RepID=UPI001A0BFD24|nr:SDR family oxidoreductase [Thiomicrospira sp.]MBE0494456.1 SDR family oxidoreductase [Thiomicrospira sp.]